LYCVLLFYFTSIIRGKNFHYIYSCITGWINLEIFQNVDISANVTHKKERQYAYNVTLRRVRETIVCREKAINIRYFSVCVCVRACVRACVGGWVDGWMGACWGACSCAFACVDLLIQHATRMRHIVLSFVVSDSSILFNIIS
jgi:hypothetical protein